MKELLVPRTTISLVMVMFTFNPTGGVVLRSIFLYSKNLPDLFVFVKIKN